MQLGNLPLRLMNAYFSMPRQEGLDFLEEFRIPQIILRKYPSPEDRADAFDGAFTGFHVHLHLQEGGDKEDWLEEIGDWYENFGHKPGGPFHFGLAETLRCCNMLNFYHEAIHYIKRRAKIGAA